MPRFRYPLFVCLGLLLFLTNDLEAQPELVPAEHPVYDFLHSQRIAGRLATFDHEMSPTSRSVVVAHLRSLLDRRSDLATSEIGWLDDFVVEFVEPEESIATVWNAGKVHIPMGKDTRKFLYYRRESDWKFAIEAEGALQSRVASLDGENYNGISLLPVLRFQGNYAGIIGFYSSTFNGQQIAGDTRSLSQDPILSQLYYIGRAENPPGNFDRTTAAVTVNYRSFFAELGNTRLLSGPTFDRSLILADATDYTPSLRLGLNTSIVQYQFIHAALSDRPLQERYQIDGDDHINIVGVPRFMAFHRFNFRPAHWLSLAFSEMIVYGRRGPELIYLLPVIPFKTAEHALWDRDNTLFALDVVVRPLPGIEAYATWLADDIDLEFLGEKSYFNKWGLQTGIGATIPGWGMAFLEYVRTEPFLYTHRFLFNDSFYNAYQHNGSVLGHPIGPNADQLIAGVNVWLPGRVRVKASVRRERRGENQLASDGTLINVGGDIGAGQLPNYRAFEKVFLGGDRFNGFGYRASLEWQPIRDYSLSLYLDGMDWDNNGGREFFARTEIRVSL